MTAPKFRIQLRTKDRIYKLGEALHKGKRNRRRMLERAK